MFYRLSTMKIGLRLLVLGTFCVPGRAVAGEGRVQFDVASVVSCRDVTPLEYAAHFPNEMLLEARVEISVLQNPGSSLALTEVLFRIESPERSLRVTDYLPKTTLMTGVVGNITSERHEQGNSAWDFSVVAPPASPVQASASASQKSNYETHARLEHLPPLELVAASGTANRGCGVYFKLKATPRTSLEGAHDFVIFFRVPKTWRGDYLQVNCEAFGRGQEAMFSPQENHRGGARSFIVALHLAGDPAARSAAEELVRAERELRLAARRVVPSSTDSRFLWSELAVAFGAKKQPLPANWIEQVVFGPASSSGEGVTSRLSSTARKATEQFVQSKQNLMQSGKLARLPEVAQMP